MPGDARQVTGLLNRLWATCQALGQPASLRLVDQVLDELFPTAHAVVRLDDIQRVVCNEFGIEPDVLRSDRRSHQVSHPRMLAMYLARKFTRAAPRKSASSSVDAATVRSSPRTAVDRWVNDGEHLRCLHRDCNVREVLTRLERSLRA